MAKKDIGNFTEAELRSFISESPIAFGSKEQKEQTEHSSSVAPSEGNSPSVEEAVVEQGKDSLFPIVEENSVLSQTQAPVSSLATDTPPAIARRVSSKQRKLSLDEYRATFLQVPRIVNRRPVFVSEEVRQKLDLIVLRLSDTRRMSVTGLLENICRHHIAMYEDDIEQWRKL